MKRVCIVTGTRAEYGLLRWVMDGIQQSTLLELQLIVTGMHLSPEFGLTYKSIEADGFKIDKKIEMLLSSDTAVSISKSTGLGLIGFADALDDLKPDLLIVLGDRYELLAASSAALFARIPIAHIHGGETTEGAFDEAIRHSITKMSHIHFVAAKEYRDRVIQLGENPNNVFIVGGLGIDNILKLNLLPKNDLENDLKFQFGLKNLLITFHPVTLENNTSEQQINAILEALNHFPDIHLIFTMPNSDSNSRIIFECIRNYVDKRENASVFTSLGQLRYLSALQFVDAVVGNSSSGIIEVPTFKKATINIGDRQTGRLKSSSIIDCEPDKNSIITSLDRIYSQDFQLSLPAIVNPYGTGGASSKIVKILETLNWDKNRKKSFYNIPVLN